MLQNSCKRVQRACWGLSVRSALRAERMFAHAAVLSHRHIQDPASQRLTWNKPPLNVLVIRKIRDEGLLEPFKELCRFLVEVGHTKAQGKCLLIIYRLIDGFTLLSSSFGLNKTSLCVIPC